jgi:hypothetical protein
VLFGDEPFVRRGGGEWGAEERGQFFQLLFRRASKLPPAMMTGAAASLSSSAARSNAADSGGAGGGGFGSQDGSGSVTSRFWMSRGMPINQALSSRHRLPDRFSQESRTRSPVKVTLILVTGLNISR